MRYIHQAPSVLQDRTLFTCPSNARTYSDSLQACKPLCLCRRKSARQLSVIKHSKASSQGSHADQNIPANIPTSKTAALPSRSLSVSRLAPASNTGAHQSISPAVVLSQNASTHLLPATAASRHGVEGSHLLPATEGSDLPPAPATSLPAMAHGVQEQHTALCAQEDSGRQPFMVIRADSSAPTAASLSKAADTPPEKPPQHATQQQLPKQSKMQPPPAPLNTLAPHHAKVTQRSDESSLSDQCSRSGSFDKPGTSQEVGHVRHMRQPVSSGSLDTAASSNSNAAAAAVVSAAVPQSASTRQASAKDAMSRQPSSTVAQSDGVCDGVHNGSPTGSRATAASASEGRAGLVDGASCRDSGLSSKPSNRARAGAVAAGRQKKSKGASIEVSSWWLSRCLPLSASFHAVGCLDTVHVWHSLPPASVSCVNRQSLGNAAKTQQRCSSNQSPGQAGDN